ncbi:Na+:solute symporter [Belliella kenyensis]|uniref:Na+:solute symporter n=1 Tax=Belliella kenyensis TaxID=1472724 RepID=A0ABV8EMF2_9BACT|nr:Na+:solute symporter [Belliella kenyensis]MCH7401553.1 Na+:solute symporter [Belliella kenyensis]MDN3603167.1 Na+:solute symporter [Belliella kenyensis]
MNISYFDWAIIAAFFVISLIIGLMTARKAGTSSKAFFLSGRNMPWWLLGVSMVATTFSADTPNLVTDIVRKNGVSGNWAWWAFLLTGMLTVFVYAKLWRRSEATTDLEFYEIRYGGRPAAFLRAFRALYLGVFFNVIIMATVALAAIKISGIMLGLGPYETLIIVAFVTVVYSSLGGLKGVLLTDFFQFFIAMIGAVWAAIYVLGLPEIGSLDNLLAHPNVADKLDFFPSFEDANLYVPLLLMPLAIQWWATWYPGAEPGGGGYIAQRMLSAKDEKNAIGATLFFNIAHYGMRPWPWIIIALASLVIFPQVSDIQAAFPHIPEDKLGHDLAYSAMLTYLPSGLIGIVLASLIAAVMSTLSTHLNWGSSYVVNDFYQRFIKPDASEKELVMVGRLSTVLLMVMAAFLALALTNALEAFNILLQIGAGTGAIFILRWFWWRINAYTEIAGMIISFFVALFFEKINPELGLIHIAEGQEYLKILYGVGITSFGWILVTFITKPEDDEVLLNFYRKIKPASIGWKSVLKRYPHEKEEQGRLPREIGLMVVGSIMVYAVLFAVGLWLYGEALPASVASIIALAGGGIIIKSWKGMR